jgi:vacuolar iron transporter family protein
MEKRLVYAGAFVLGLNDALVELTGALAGLTFALQNTSLIALTGLITGIAASLSMAGSSYLQSKEDQHHGKEPLMAAWYTGLAYIFTVLLLVAPYFIFDNPYTALPVTLLIAVTIILCYTIYVSKQRKTSFMPKFLEMTMISLGVAVISFGVGWLLRIVIGVDI